ncbi:hypothetical protein [Chitinophaga sancti]|uniref:hypothetical protein n=1 Tax=Chitinophaga sancti TaxID=1004 RepID=UPI003F7AAD6F
MLNEEMNDTFSLNDHRDKIYPRIFLLDELREEILQTLGEDADVDADFPIYHLWLKDVALGFVVDRGEKYTFISKRHLGIEMTEEELSALALKNFERDFEFRLVETVFGCYQVCGDPDHCVTAMFVAPMWEKIVAPMGKDIVVAFPGYDLLFLTPADDEEGIANLKMELYKIHGMGIEKPLKDYLFLYKLEKKEWSFVMCDDYTPD